MSISDSPRPNLEQRKNQAKDLLKAHRAGHRAAMARLRAHLSALSDATDTQIQQASFSLLDAQLVVAREHGFANWSAMKQHIESLPPAADVEVSVPQREEDRGWIDMKWRGIENGEEGASPKPKADYSLLEQAFIEAAMVSRWNPKPKSYVPQLAALLKQEPGLIDSVGHIALAVALPYGGSEPTVRFLLDQGVRRLDLKTDAYNALHEAVYEGLIENLRGVFAAGLADATGIALKRPHVGWPAHVSLLYWSCFQADPAMTQLLLDHGADMHLELRFKAHGSLGHTALQVAVAQEDDPRYPVARVLIERGAYYDIFSASALNDVARVTELLREDPHAVHATEEYQSTPLHWAVRAGALKCAALLLEGGADVNAVNKGKATPLHLAASKRDNERIWLLAEHGADLDIPDGKGRTALHLATSKGRVEVAEALIVLGASTRVKNRKGKTPLEVARKDCRYLKPQPV
ncbi:MAG: hypothetical protein GKR89_36385 [Candidatus Latescibacteria bacterium]|nr:hypothetical protein [Candidatus Latescibacterota bacterium]